MPKSAMSISQDSSVNNTSSSSSSPTSRFFRRILNFKKKRDQYEQPQPSLTGIPKLRQQLARIVDAIKVPKVFSKESKSAAAAAAAPPPTLLSWHLLTVLEGSLETLETYCICYREECQELLQVCVVGTEMILEHFGQAPMFLPTRNPAMDYTQAVSCFQLALALIIQREGRSTPILSKISLRSSRLQQNLGDRSLGIFWKGTNTTLQELHVINVHCIKNNLSL